MILKSSFVLLLIVAKPSYSQGVDTVFYKNFISDCKYLLKNDPLNLAVMQKLGLAYMNIGDFDNAEVYFRTTCSLDSNSRLGFYGLAYCLYQKNKLELAMSYVDRAIKIDPNYVYSHYLKAEVLYANKNWNEALRQYSISFSLSPKMIAAVSGKVNCFIHLNKYGRAMANIRYMLEKGYEICTNSLSMAFVYIKTRKYSRALNLLKTMDNQDSNCEHDRVNYLFALLYKKSNRIDKMYFYCDLLKDSNMKYFDEEAICKK